MNWEDIRIFEAASSSGSLSAGAQVLGLSQSQMSRRLREFEYKIGARLFDRTPQGLRPTRAGAELIPLVAEMRRAADAIHRIKPNLANKQMSVVRISADEVRQYFITSNICQLRKELTGVELEVFAGHEHLDHESRMTDIQVRSCLPSNESLIAKRLGEITYGLYASPDFLKKIKFASTADESKLQRSDWIGVSPDHLWYPLQKKWLEEFFLVPSQVRFNTVTGMIQGARSGAGIALLPSFMANAEPDIVHLPVNRQTLKTTEYLIVHRDLLREKAVRRTVDALAKLYKQEHNNLYSEYL